jgi:hypothetical protein
MRKKVFIKSIEVKEFRGRKTVYVYYQDIDEFSNPKGETKKAFLITTLDSIQEVDILIPKGMKKERLSFI